jgi:hypothetical protein
VLADRAESGESAAIRGRRIRPIPNPPQVAVPPRSAAPRLGIHLVHRRDRARALADPRAWHDLPAVPVAIAQHQVADARHVTHGEVHVIGAVDGAGGVAGAAVQLAPEVLHAQWLYQLALQRVVDAAAGELLEDRAEHVEVPVAVQVVFAGLLRPARRSAGQVVTGVGGGVVDAGAGREQMPHLRLLLRRRQTQHVIDAELCERALEVDDAAIDVDAVEHRENTLPHGGEVADRVDVAVLEQHAPADHDHHCGRRHRGYLLVHGGEGGRREAGRLGNGDRLPCRNREDVGLAGLLDGRALSERERGRQREQQRDGRAHREATERES